MPYFTSKVIYVILKTVMRHWGAFPALVNLRGTRKASNVDSDGEHTTMSLYILPKERLPEFVRALQAHFRVVGPVRTETGYAFEDITEAEQLQLNYNTTVLPPKKYFLPPHEVLFDFHTQAMATAPGILRCVPCIRTCSRP